ncbi:MAG: extracellular solute-binding protein [Chloroflexi bacterium]|nr:extracellular solute-binding protein [Chloroflexota bacterium]
MTLYLRLSRLSAEGARLDARSGLHFQPMPNAQRPAVRRRRFSRRRVLGAGLGAAALVACGEAAPEATPAPSPIPTPPPTAPPPQPPAPAQLRLLGWPFRPDLLRQRLDAFERYRGDVRVLHEQAQHDYPVRALEALTRLPSVDVVQARDGLVGAWWSGRALQTMGAEDTWRVVLDAMWPHARQSVTLGGQVVGLPYYADVMLLAYNRQLLDRVGAPVPSTLEELTDVCRDAARRQIVEFGISLNLAPKVFTNLPWWGLVYASGGRLAAPDGPDPAAVAVLEWLRDASAVSNVVDPDFGLATYDALAREQHIFSIVGAHVLRRLNQASPGAFGVAPIPGIASPLGTVAWTPLYSVAANTPRPADAVDLVNYLGGPGPAGDYASAAFWLQQEGLIPAYRQLLDRPEVEGDLAAWIDPNALTSILAAARPVERLWERWFLSWEHELQIQVQEAIFGRQSADGALAAAEAVARELALDSGG